MKLCDGLFVLPLFVLLLIMYSNALQIPSYETLVMFFTSSAQVSRGYVPTTTFPSTSQYELKEPNSKYSLHLPDLLCFGTRWFSNVSQLDKVPSETH